MAARQGHPLATVLTLTLLAGALAVMVLTARHPGVWIDEIWSLWMAEPGLPFTAALTERWMQDAHPPLFHFANWVVSGFVGQDVSERRLLNLAPVLYFAAACLVVWRRSETARPFILVFAAILLTSRAAFWYFPEHRSYFAVLMVVGALCVLLFETFLAGEDLDLRRDRGFAAFLGVTILLSLNLHYITVVFVGAILGAAFLAHAWRRRRRTAWFIFIAVGLSLTLLLAGLAGQWPYLASTAGKFWIETLPGEAAHMLAAAPARAIASNRIALLAVIAVIATALFRRGAARSVVPQPARGAWEFAAATAAGLIFASLVLLAASFAKPILVPRYIVGAVPAAASVLAAIAAPAILSRPWIVVLFCLNAALLIRVYAQAPLHNPRWATTIDHIRQVVAACPATPVYALDPRFNSAVRSPNGPLIHNWGYQLQGRLNGFQVTILDARQPRAPAMSSTCPTLLWAEHVNLKGGPPKLFRTPLAQTPEMKAALAAATVFRGTSGFVVEIKPVRGAAGAYAGS